MSDDRFADFNVKSDRVKASPDCYTDVLTIDNFLKELGKEKVRL